VFSENSAVNLITEKEIYEKLEEVMDPEIPKLSVVDLGIITGVKLDEGNNVFIKMTPTFAGCPAVEMMKDDIKEKVSELDVKDVNVELSFDVQWNSNMLTDKGRRILSESGFALPGKHSGTIQIDMLTHVECPFCHSKNTRLDTPFGPTLCRAIHYCKDCLQSFEQFKPV
jgi:ring-1,2-phenylacetyl-CoA epoxidase subunit PaaD